MQAIPVSILVLALSSVTNIALAKDDWWEYGHFYQIYPRSFQDSDGDGVGDLNGITSRLSHLKSINVSGVWLSPIFKSPMKDMGYDISDFRDIDPIFGTMDDFDRLIKRCQELDIKLILDFVPNHTSDQHEWFKASSNPSHPDHKKYRDYYLWNEGKRLRGGKRAPPSNWKSIFSGSMWTWVESRKAFYLHQFLKEQPDLNFRNKVVQEEMNEVLRFWLRKGVSGFRIDAVPHLYEVKENRRGLYDDEPINWQCKDNPDSECSLIHTKTQHLVETYQLIYQWRKVMEESEFKKQTRILMTEAYGSLSQMIKYYGKVRRGKVTDYGSHVPFNFNLMAIDRWAGGSEFISSINQWIDNIPKGKGIQPNWVMGNHDWGRVATRFGPERIDIFNILIKTLPGITVTYNGEEIGMTNVEETASTDFRFPARSPFQWDNSTSAGFSTNPKPWLPVAKNYTKNNVELQMSQEISHLKVFQRLVSLRQSPAFKYGSLTMKSINDGKVLVYKREIANDPNSDIFVVALNLSNGKKISDIDLTSVLGALPKEMEVVISSVHSNRMSEMVDTSSLSIGAFDGLVLRGQN